MKLTEMQDIVLIPMVSKKSAKLLQRMKKAVLQYGPATVTARPISPTTVEFIAEFHRWLRPDSIEDVYSDMAHEVHLLDEEGWVHTDGPGDNAVGAEFVEAILMGLRKGMKLDAEAFFPTLSYEVKWKNIISK